MMKTVLLVIASFLAPAARAGDTLSLAQCWELGEAAYPLTANAPLLDEALALQLQALHTNYYPHLLLTAQATYQSDVTSLNLLAAPFPINIATPARDQYKVALEVQQNIFDAGQTRHSKNLERLGTQEAVLADKASWHARKQQIEQLYFAGLLYRAQQKVATLLIETIAQNVLTVASAVNNGVLQPRDLQLLEVEQLHAEQQLAEAVGNFAACVKMLEQLVQAAIPDATTFIIPAVPAEAPHTPISNLRAEFRAFDVRKERLLATGALLNAELMPRIGLFGQAGYGRPGLNILSNTFDPYYLVGVRLLWTPWNWGNTQKLKRVQQVQAKITGNRQAEFDENVRMQAWSARYEISKQTKFLAQDVQMVALREEITRQSASQMTNGAITTSDYLADLNAEMTARINHEIHRIRLAKSHIDYQLLLNIE